LPRRAPPRLAEWAGMLGTGGPGALEGLDVLRRRVDEAIRFIDLKHLAISPQCGFASTVAGNPVSEADERAKLALVVNAAAPIRAEVTPREPDQCPDLLTSRFLDSSFA